MNALHHDARLFASLGDPNRLAMFSLLCKHGGTLHVEGLRTMLAEEHDCILAQPTISHHLRQLYQTGLIDYTQHGIYTYYFVCPEVLRRLHYMLATLHPLDRKDTHP